MEGENELKSIIFIGTFLMLFLAFGLLFMVLFYQRHLAKIKKKEAELFAKIKARYDEQVSPYYAASRLWTDAIIDPLDTRTWISMGIEAANHAPIEKKFNLGVIQV